MSESGDLPHKSRNQGSSGSNGSSKSRLGGTSHEPLPLQRQTRLERDRLANAQSVRNGRNGHGNATQQTNGNYAREVNSFAFEPVVAMDKRRQRNVAVRDKPSDRTSPNFWNRLFRRNSSRTAQKQKRDQSSNAARLRVEAPSFVAGGRQGSTALTPDREGSLKRSRSSATSLENGNGSHPLRSAPFRDTGLRAPTLLQPSVQAGIRDRYNQLLPRKASMGRSGATTSGGNRALRQNSNQFNGTAGRPVSQASRRENGSLKPRPRGVSAALYAARMVILSVGVGVLAGTLLSMWDPASRSPAGASQQNKPASVVATSNSGGVAPLNQMPRLGQEMTPLKSALQTMIGKAPQMATGIFLLDLDKNAYVDINGGTIFSSASTIKVPILVAFFQELDAGKIRLDEPLTLRKDLVGSGSGEMQYQPPGTRFTALETITKMITISDNTATNMIVARLGGMNALNQQFKSWGMQSTAINRPLPDLQGTNTTSPRDMAILMARVSQGELISLRSRDRMLEIMRQTENRSQLSQGLGAGATISHKTGDIGAMIGDVGLIDLPNGKRYAAAVLVKRSFNDDQAYEFVSQISRLAYQYFTRLTGSQTSAVPSIVPSAPISPTASPSSPTGHSYPSPETETLRSPDSSPATSGDESGDSSSEETTPH